MTNDGSFAEKIPKVYKTLMSGSFPGFSLKKMQNIENKNSAVVQKILKDSGMIQMLKVVWNLFLKTWPLYSWLLGTLEIEFSYLECELLFKDFLSGVSQGQNRHSES